MLARTTTSIVLCVALMACGGKNNGTEDAEADATPDVEDVTEVADPGTDPAVEPVVDPATEPVEDMVEDAPWDGEADAEEDVEPDETEDAVIDAEDDTEDDARLDAVDASVDGGSDAGTDSHTVMLFFSEYVEGTGNNKAVEIYNAGTAAYDIGGCTVNIYSNGSSTTSASITLTTLSLAADDVHTLCHSGLISTGTVSCDQSHGSVSFNGNDAVELVCGGTVYDVIGQIGYDPGTEWGTGGVTTMAHTLRRKCAIVAGDSNGADAFDPATEWDGFGVNVFTGLGDHCP